MEDREVQDEARLHDRYQLGALLGFGGFSVVYRARDLQTGRDVVIKQITLRGLSVEETIEATDTFNREVSMLSALRHPQVPRIYDHFSDREHWYLVLEYLEGTTLETYLETRTAKSDPLQVEEALEMALQLCGVLQYLHTQEPPVIFRDLKPGNLIRSPGGTLCLIDFGIARHFHLGQARDTQVLGSPGYAAPEQYGRAQTTPQSDIYSLGVLLYALLSGQDPVKQPLGLALLRLDPEAFGTELTTLLQRMLSLDPRDRPATMREVASLLEAIRHQRVTQDATRLWRPPLPQALPSLMAGQQAIQIQLPAPPGKTAFPTRKGRASRRSVLIGLGALAAAAIAGGGIWWINTSSPPSLSSSSSLYSYRGHTQPVTGIAWSPDGKYIASGSDDRTVQVWDAANGEHLLTYRGHSFWVNAVAWSPDGKYIASASETVQVWDAANGGLRLRYYLGPVDTVTVTALAWSPDGKCIASGSNDQTVQVWDAANGGLRLPYQGHKGAVTALAWSPDGKYIASGSTDQTVQVWDAANGGLRLTYGGHKDVVAAVAWSPDGRRIASGSADDTAQVWNAPLSTQGETGELSTGQAVAHPG
jgi:serine/threonine protein kinase